MVEVCAIKDCGANAALVAARTYGNLCQHDGADAPKDCVKRQIEDGGNILIAHAPAVGDVSSADIGTGARYNNGKPPMEMIPIWIIAEAMGRRQHDDQPDDWQPYRSLQNLGHWQRDKMDMQEVLSQVPLDAWDDAARVFHHVTTRLVKPYPAWNWAKGMKWSVPTACAVRHMLAEISGEHLDPETNLPHRGHWLCNLIMLAYYEAFYKEGDDRPAILISTPPGISGFKKTAKPYTGPSFDAV